jgi:hypothetical protein
MYTNQTLLLSLSGFTCIAHLPFTFKKTKACKSPITMIKNTVLSIDSTVSHMSKMHMQIHLGFWNGLLALIKWEIKAATKKGDKCIIEM